MAATPRPHASPSVPVTAPDAGGNGSTNAPEALDGGLGDFLTQRFADESIRVDPGTAPALGQPDPIADLAADRGLARHFNEAGQQVAHPATGRPSGK